MYRPWVTFPDGSQGWIAMNVKTEADRQTALNIASAITIQQSRIDPASVSPHQVRDLSAKVEFFRVAMG